MRGFLGVSAQLVDQLAGRRLPDAGDHVIGDADDRLAVGRRGEVADPFLVSVDGADPPAGSRAASHQMGWAMDRFRDDDVLRSVQRLAPIAEGLGITMAELSLGWVLREEHVASAIIGASRPEQVEENAGASGIELDDATLKAIDDAVAGVVVR